MATQIPNEKRKRVRIMPNVEEFYYTRKEGNTSAATMQTVFPARKQERRCFNGNLYAYKDVPEMSEEMMSVMSSFNMLKTDKDDEEEDQALKTEEDLRNGERGKLRPISKGQNSSVPSLPGLSNRTNFSTVVRLSSAVHSACRDMRKKSKVDEIKMNEKEKLKRSKSDACYSPKTQRLLDRSANVYGRIDRIQDHVKLIQSESRCWVSVDKAIESGAKKQQRPAKLNNNTFKHVLPQNNDKMPLKQRSLDEGSKLPRRGVQFAKDEQEATSLQSIPRRGRSSTFS